MRGSAVTISWYCPSRTWNREGLHTLCLSMDDHGSLMEVRLVATSMDDLKDVDGLLADLLRISLYTDSCSTVSCCV